MSLGTPGVLFTKDRESCRGGLTECSFNGHFVEQWRKGPGVVFFMKILGPQKVLNYFCAFLSRVNFVQKITRLILVALKSLIKND